MTPTTLFVLIFSFSFWATLLILYLRQIVGELSKIRHILDLLAPSPAEAPHDPEPLHI